MAASEEKSPRLRRLPARFIFEGKNLLNPLGPAAAAVLKHFQGLPNLLHARVGVRLACARAAPDPVQDRGEIQQLGAGFEEIAIQSVRSNKRCHGCVTRSCTGACFRGSRAYSGCRSENLPG